MTSRYLITGGLGLIGSELANQLTGPTTIISRSDNHMERLKRKGVRMVYKDIAEITPGDLSHIDVVYHLASTVDNYNILTDPYVDTETNIKGTIRLLECCKQQRKKPKFMFLSTFFVYGNQYEKQKSPIDENSPTDPLALYPATKLCAESAIKLYGKLYDIPYLICRLTNVYGENESYTNKKKGALNYLIMKAVRGEKLEIYKGGNFFRDFIHVKDVVSALKFLEPRVENDTYLIGFGTPVIFRDVIDFIHKHTGERSIIQEVEPPPFHAVVGIHNFVANTKKINALGWHPSITPKNGLLKIINLYQSMITSSS